MGEPGISTDHEPSLWVVLGDKLGDNAQVMEVVRDLGWPFVHKNIAFQEEWRLGKPAFSASLFHVAADKSDALEGPWPDYVITVGRRCAMVAQWIRKQSGGRTRVILFGRPKKGLDDYALVVAPGQYTLPDVGNVLRIKLPLMRVSEEKLEAGRCEWAEELGALPRPLTAVLVGGPTKPYDMTVASARSFAAGLIEQAGNEGGSVYLTTSRRTPPAIVSTLEKELEGRAQFHRFEPGQERNPYFGLLACADRFVVSGDSVSMMVEVARLGKPLAIWELPKRPGLAARAHEPALRLFHRPGAPLSGLAGVLRGAGILGFPRDLGAIHRVLYECGAARPLGRGFPSDLAMIEDEVRAVSERIRDLVKTDNRAGGFAGTGEE